MEVTNSAKTLISRSDSAVASFSMWKTSVRSDDIIQMSDGKEVDIVNC